MSRTTRNQSDGQPKSPKPRKRTRKERQPTSKPVWNGIQFASKFEKDFAQFLTKEGLTWEYEADTFYWFPNPRVYRPDFKVYNNDGSFYYIETKGFFDPNSRAKMAAIKKQYPEADIRMVFMDPNKKVTKAKSGKSYSEWADKAGYKWSSFCIPKDWRGSD